MERKGFADVKFNNRVFLIFMAGFMAGLALIYIGQQKLVAGTAFLGSFSVERIGLLDVDKSMLFLYSIRERGGPVVFLILLAAAGAGGLAVCLYLMWTGFCAGVILSVLSLRYGIRGILLFLGGCLPQIFLLIPAYLLLFRWCVLLPGRGRRGGAFLEAGLSGKTLMGAGQGKGGGRLGILFAAVILLLLGCVIEGYVNPLILKQFMVLF